MSNVVTLHEALSRLLARELGTSVEFVEACQGFNVTPAQGKNLLRWFLRCSASQRGVVMKCVLRDVKSTRVRAKRLRRTVDVVVPIVAPAAFEDIQPDSERTITRASLASSWGCAQRKADVDGILALNAASYAGMLLANADGDAARALASIADVPGSFRSTVRGYLESLLDCGSGVTP